MINVENKCCCNHSHIISIDTNYPMSDLRHRYINNLRIPSASDLCVIHRHSNNTNYIASTTNSNISSDSEDLNTMKLEAGHTNYYAPHKSIW